MSNELVQTFNFCGGTQSFTVPEGFLSTVDVYMWGAGGGGGGADGNGPGGAGAAGYYLAESITLNAYDNVTVAVGGGGGAGSSSSGGGRGSAGQSYVTTVFNSRYPPNGAAVYHYTNGAWSGFLNTYGVWDSSGNSGSFDRTYTVTFPVTGYYYVEASCDNYGHIYLDGTEILTVPNYNYSVSTSVYVTAGTHTLRTYGINYGGPAAIGVLVSLSSMSGGYGGAAGPSGWSGGGGGGGGATTLFVNSTAIAVAAGGGGGGGGSHNRAAYSASNSVSTSPDKNGANCPGDGGGGGGGGGGIASGAGGSYGYDNSSGGQGGYSGSSSSGAMAGISTSPSGTSTGRWLAPAGRGGAQGEAGGNGLLVLVFRTLGSGKVKVNNAWHNLTSTSVKVGGSWRNITGTWVKVNGVWTLLKSTSPNSISTTFSNSNFGR